MTFHGFYIIVFTETLFEANESLQFFIRFDAMQKVRRLQSYKVFSPDENFEN